VHPGFCRQLWPIGQVLYDVFRVVLAGQIQAQCEVAATTAAVAGSSSSASAPQLTAASVAQAVVTMQQQHQPDEAAAAGTAPSAVAQQQQEAAAAAAARAYAFRHVLTFSDDEDFTVAIGGVTESDTDTEELMGHVDWSLAQNSDDEWPPGPPGPPRWVSQH
jgi:acyl-CoA synthetase (NDP forming)